MTENTKYLRTIINEKEKEMISKESQMKSSFEQQILQNCERLAEELKS